MSSRTSQTLPAPVVHALVRGNHADPFAVLGPHALLEEQGAGLAIRAFRPHARAIAVRRLSDDQLFEMTRIHPDGFFEVVVPPTASSGDRGLFDYRYRVTWADGATAEIDDPYRYGPVLTDFDRYLLAEGTHRRIYDSLGARVFTHETRAGVHFAVWAPNARRVSVVGDWNGWDGRVHSMRSLMPNGIWEIFLPDLGPGARYKFEILTRQGHIILKTDPCGRFFETPPKTASVVWHGVEHEWSDQEWMAARPAQQQNLRKPLSIYEVHLESWRHGQDGRALSYRELAETLVPYVQQMGFTHVELLPIMEHPFSGSWGYQVIGFFAPTSRFGPPEDFQYFVDACHRAGIGVILDWVPGHFPKDAHGLARFDGTELYEHADPRQGEHKDWGTLVFNYGRNEVRSFLISNALFWIERFHIDALRVDAVASMLYLDYSRNEGEWVPNKFGGRENLEAIDFLRELNTVIGGDYPGVAMMAEESTAFPGVSRPVYLGGLGFTYKWNMGWMHDMLDYAQQDPIHRKWHHDRITFSLLYAFTENFILPFSHDEVVHGKRSMLDKMPGDLWQKHANLRALYGYMFTHPGKKLLFMGGEIGQWREWNHDGDLDWEILGDPLHAGLQRWVRDLNRAYTEHAALWDVDFEPAGFAWVDCHDHENSVVSFIRYAKDPAQHLVMVVNFTPVVRADYRIGVPKAGFYRERLNSDSDLYGGSNVGNAGGLQTEKTPSHGQAQSLSLTVPPLGILLLKPE
jgi:1,4-alpha-glucan branching enzyme